MADRILGRLHKHDPYADFPIADYPLSLWGWDSTHPIFAAVFQQLRPVLVIEVGSWLGGSAIHMADLAKAIGIPGFELVCVDTWLGADEHWLRPEWFETLNLRHGYPTLYYQFLANVIHKGHADVITPMPVSSESAYHVLKHHKVVADAVYVDAGHRYKDVRGDVENYWQLVRPGGVLFGDDFLPQFPGVIRAVDEFAEKNGVVLQVNGSKWAMQKR